MEVSLTGGEKMNFSPLVRSSAKLSWVSVSQELVDLAEEFFLGKVLNVLPDSL